MQNKKIAFLVTSLNSGGIENYLLRYLNYDRELIPYIICKSGLGGELETEYIKRVAPSDIIRCKTGYLNFVSWFRLFFLFRKNKIDVVCDFTGNFAGIPLFLSFFAGVKKRIAFYRGATNHFKETKLNLTYNFLMQRLVKIFATDILSNSKAALDFFYPQRKDSKRYKVIYNGIGTDFISIDETKEKVRERLGIPTDAFVIGHTGRYDKAKNHETIIKVAIELCTRYSDIYFVLIGKNTDVYLNQQVAEAGLSERIRLLGLRSDVAILLKAFDVFYFPSITEGQPNALLEAMISGLPIVASDILSIRECVPDKVRSMLIPPTNVNIAVKKLESYYLKHDLMKDAICKKWAIENYASDKWFGKFKEILQQ